MATLSDFHHKNQPKGHFDQAQTLPSSQYINQSMQSYLFYTHLHCAPKTSFLRVAVLILLNLKRTFSARLSGMKINMFILCSMQAAHVKNITCVDGAVHVWIAFNMFLCYFFFLYLQKSIHRLVVYIYLFSQCIFYYISHTAIAQFSFKQRKHTQSMQCNTF